MDDSEKLKALKKAYADIIMNTAKEAAVRIMVSERKATRFEHELVSTKQEWLRMLLRLKQMLDSKVNVVETMSLSQQKKIEELEAQLQEAEEIVGDLRAELTETQAVLEKVTNNKGHSQVVHNIKGAITAQENCLQEKRLDPSHGSVYSDSNLQFDSVATYDTRNSAVNGTNNGSKFCVPHDHIDNCYFHNPDFAPIVIRRKETELYRNGCTQRIRAFERNLYDGNVSLSGNVDDVQNETLIRVDECKAVSVTANPKADIICEMDKPDAVEVGKEVADPVGVSVPRKKARLRVQFQPKLHSDQGKETNKASKFSCTNGFSRVLHTNAPPLKKKRKSSTMVCANEAQKNLVSLSFTKVSTDATSMIEQSGSHNVKNETSVKVDEGKAVHVTTNPKADIILETDKLDDVKVVNEDADPIRVSVPQEKAKLRLSLWPILHSEQVKETNKASHFCCTKGSPCILDTNAPLKKRKNSSRARANEPKKDPISPSFCKVSPDATTMVEQSGSHNDTEKDEIFLEACSAWNKMKNVKEPLNESDLTRQKSLSIEKLDVPACKADTGAANGASDKLDSEVSDLDEKVSRQFVNFKFYKYTFQRKHKKEAIRGPDTNCSLQNSSSNKKCGKKQNDHVEPEKSCPRIESTQDSQ